MSSSTATTGPSTVTYRYGASSVCAQRLSRCSRSISTAFCEVLPVMKLTVPPGSYEYQIGIVSGARPSAVTLTTPTCRSARNASRSAGVMASDTVRLLDRACVAQLGQLVGSEAPIGERLVGVLAGLGRPSCDRARRAREPRCRSGLQHTIVLHDGLARLDVRMARRFTHRENGRETGVGLFEDRGPLVTRLGLE